MKSTFNRPSEPANLADARFREPVRVTALMGERAFRRRLMELGVLPGTLVEVLRVAPLGDPLEVLVRGACLTLRRAEARSILVGPAVAEASAREAAE